VSRARPLLLTVLAAAIAGGLTPPAGAQQPDTGLFSITPSSQTVVGRPPTTLGRTLVRNTTKASLEVTVFPVILGQDVNGSFTFSESARDLNAAQKILSPSERAFVMAPNTSHDVRLRWNLLPRGARAAHLGVVFQSRARAPSGETVKTVQRLLTLDFLRLPGPYRSSGALTRLRASQGPKKTLLFYPRIKNTGEFVTKPTNGRFRIRDAKGQIVFQTTWPGASVLPGFEREFPIEVRKVLPAGDYGAVATADFGRSKGLKIIHRFTLVGPNQLPTGRITIDAFHGEGVLGGDSKVTGVIKSIGSAPATTAVRLDLYKLLPSGQQPQTPAQTKRLAFPEPIAPGNSVPLELVYPKLAAGTYRVIGTYRAEQGSLKEVVSDFTPQQERSGWQKFKDWVREHKGLLIGIGLLLLLLLLVWFFLRRQRRLQRALDEARAGQAEAPIAMAAAPGPAPAADAPPAPAQPVAPPPAGVDINTAGIAELQALPGVGPKAAERIVAHRDEYGAFASVEDLANVEGFGAKRVTALRDRARV
jgi:competence ComEA-like helix-hairpin-helix protein